MSIMSSSTVFLVTLSITHLRVDVDVVPEIDYPRDVCLPRSHLISQSSTQKKGMQLSQG